VGLLYSHENVCFRKLPNGDRSNDERVAIQDEPRVVDCYCSTGAFARGFSDAGYRIVARVDKDWYAASTFSVSCQL